MVCLGAKIIYDPYRLKINIIIKIGFFLGKHASQSGKLLFYDLFHRNQFEVIDDGSFRETVGN